MARILKPLAKAGFPLILATLACSPAIAADSHQGEIVFKQNCAICHTPVKGAPSGVGPRLYGVVGRRAGTLPGYNYSQAMKHSGLTWTPKELNLYIDDPQKVVPGNKMPFAGLHNHEQREDVIAYLETLK